MFLSYVMAQTMHTSNEAFRWLVGQKKEKGKEGGTSKRTSADKKVPGHAPLGIGQIGYIVSPNNNPVLL
jgi:hypothetical protein